MPHNQVDDKLGMQQAATAFSLLLTCLVQDMGCAITLKLMKVYCHLGIGCCATGVHDSAQVIALRLGSRHQIAFAQEDELVIGLASHPQLLQLLHDICRHRHFAASATVAFL